MENSGLKLNIRHFCLLSLLSVSLIGGPFQKNIANARSVPAIPDIDVSRT